MNHLQKFRRQLYRIFLGISVLEGAALIAAWGLTSKSTVSPYILAAAGVAVIIINLAVAYLVSSLAVAPLQSVWQAVLHISPSEHGFAAPQTDTLGPGKELATTVISQIYALNDSVNKAATVAEAELKKLTHNFIAQNLPLPLFVLDANKTIIFANQAAADYVGHKQTELVGQNVYPILDMSFTSTNTFDNWLKQVQGTKATAVNIWERVRINRGADRQERLFDLAAYYNQNNPDKLEIMLLLFDHTKMYSQDDQAISFVALSVHELRTPLTLLRGYIEVFEEELRATASPELQGFMDKMNAQAEQLMAYVNNILNVARIDNDQLELHLQEASWPEVLKSVIDAYSLRAKVRGITLHCRIAKNLPTVGIDRLSISEVINNLIDNAIKYSGQSQVINLDTHLTQDGVVETTVQDFGLGISPSIIPNLFTKFYRDHRNRAQVGGNGLGLYLSKAIVSAHGGNLWVRSKEGAGSTFGFTLLPYSQLADEAKRTGNNDLVRGAHGWIKNHSLYRR